MAALVTRGVSEMIKLTIKMGGKPATVSGLSGKKNSRKFFSEVFRG